MKKSKMSMVRYLSARLALAIFVVAIPLQTAFAKAIAPSLGTAQSFAVLGATAVTNTGPTVVTGDLGISPNTIASVTGFPPGVILGTIHASPDPVALQAQTDTTAAYLQLASQACPATNNLTGIDLGGLTLVPGVYCFSSSAQLTGTLTLDAQGNPNAVWVFQTGSTITTASGSSVVLINGAQACNIFWQIGSSATLGTTTTFLGNILALTSITLNTNANLFGRALARNGAVTLDSNVVTASTCLPPVIPVPPTIGKVFNPLIINAGGSSTLTITLSNANPSIAKLIANFVDTLPAGVTMTPNTATTTCSGGAVSNDANTVTLTTNSTIPANGSCTITVAVTSAVGGNHINSVAAGDLQTDQGVNVAPTVATLTVISPAITTPIISKSFAPFTITAPGVSSVKITLINNNALAADLTTDFVDILPAGLTLVGNPSTNCGGSVTVSPPNITPVTVTLDEAASIPALGSCIIMFFVRAENAGNFVNAIPAGSLETTNGINNFPAAATLTVIPPLPLPALSKSFSPNAIEACEESTLTITLLNPTSTQATLILPLIDNLPPEIEVLGHGSTTCLGGRVSVRGSSIILTEGSIPPNGSCEVNVRVTSECCGFHSNTLPAGALVTNIGSNFFPATASLLVF